MATLYKHGELGQLERVAYKVAYCADGQILRNDGDGWKQWRKLKPGVDARQHWETAKAKYQEKLSTKPAFAEWRQLFHELVPFKQRNIMLTAISLMPQDPDGVWSEVNDYFSINGDTFSIDDICQLCRAYEAASLESKPTQQEITTQ